MKADRSVFDAQGDAPALAALAIVARDGRRPWGGLMAYFALHDPYTEGRISGAGLALSIAFFLLGGCVFGACMWAFGELRFRRMAAKGNRAPR